MLQLIQNKKRLLNYFFLGFVLFFLAHLVYTFFCVDIILQISSILIDLIFIALFTTAILNLNYAFLVSVLLLPVFFFMENATIINQIYNSESLAIASVYSLDPRIIGFCTVAFFSVLVIAEKKKKIFRQVPMLKIIIPAIIVLSSSVIWSIAGQEKYVQMCFYILLLILYLVSFVSVKDVISFYRLLGFFVMLSVPAVLMAYLQIFGGVFFEYADISIKRVSGPFNSPNLLGSFLLVVFALIMIMLLAFNIKRYLKYRWLLILYLILILPIFFLTFSRSAWIGIVVFSVIFSLHNKRFFAGAVLTFILLLSVMLVFETTRERINGFSERTMFDSVYARTEIWRLSYKKFLEKPFLGYGAGSFSETINDAKESAGGTDNPHNDIVFFAVEGGIIGVISFVSIIVAFYINLFKIQFITLRKKVHRTDGKIKWNILSLGIIALFVATTVIGTLESYYEGNFLHLFLWSVLGGWFALAKRKMV